MQKVGSAEIYKSTNDPLCFKKVTHCHNSVIILVVTKLQLEILFVNIKAAIEDLNLK